MAARLAAGLVQLPGVRLVQAVQANPALAGAILRVAEAAGMMDFAAQIAGIIETADGRPHDDARFPIPALRPAGGFRLDPALVYALTRLIDIADGR